MPFNVDAVTLTLVALCAALVIGIIVYIAIEKAKVRRRQRSLAAIRAVIVDYFRRSGVSVAAECTEINGLYTAMVESEPMKRFRLSHIIEMTLREHVEKACGLELDRIFWRFPIKEAVPGQVDERNPEGREEKSEKRPEPSDEYINEGLENYRHIPKPEVTELPWETFEEMSTTGGREKR